MWGGARELLGTLQTLESAEKLLFSFCPKLTPASLHQSPILVGTLGDKTLMRPAALGVDLDSRGRLSLRGQGEGTRSSTR